MSLKAKLEAVIYAAEEPVTLAQLALLFTADALEWKAEQQAATAAPAPVENAEFDYDSAGRDPDQADAAPQQPAPEAAPVPKEGESTALDQPEAGSAEPDSQAEPGGESNSSGEAAAEADLKRQARQRDREVRAILRQLLDELIATYASDSRGVEIREIAGGYRMATKPECHDAVRAFVKSLKPALKLSLPALETLAVVAYKQPVTAPEVNEIRGVDSSGVFGSLLARKLIATAGRKPVIGRPILYKTTKEFLVRFGLKDLSELPSMDEFEKMAALEFDEPEIAEPAIPESDPASESDSEPEIGPNGSQERDSANSNKPAEELAPSLEAEPAPDSPAPTSAAPEASADNSPG